MKTSTMKTVRNEQDRSTGLSAFGSDDERLAAIRRTVEATDADGIDVGGLAARAVEAYWTDREEQIQADLAAAKADTIKDAMAIAARIGDPIREFLSDLVAPIAPTAILICLYVLLARSDTAAVIQHPRWSAIIVGLVALLGAVLFGLIARKHKSDPRVIEFERHSLGALASGVLIGALTLGVVAFQVKQRRDASIDAAKRQLQQLVVLSLESWHRTGSFLEDPQIVRAAHTVSTTHFSSEKAVYRVEAGSLPKVFVASLPGEFVADVSPEGGKLVWYRANREDVIATFLVGKVHKISSDKFLVEESNGDKKIVYFAPNIQEPTGGSTVAIALDGKSNTAEMFAEIRQ